MSNLLEYYRVLGLSIDAGIADVTSSYRRLCRIHHPDVSDDPGSEEFMKRINVAYTVLRDKLKREVKIRERQYNARPTGSNVKPDAQTCTEDSHITGKEAEGKAFSVLRSYFKAICAFDYSDAYEYLSAYDQKSSTLDSFVEWRESVARVFPMRGFRIFGGMPVSTVCFNDGRTVCARKFRVVVTEDDLEKGETRSDSVEKIVIYETGGWKVFLGYNSVGELTRAFDERYEVKLKSDAAKRWEEYYAELCPEYNMLSLVGMRKAASRELYRQQRLGGTLAFIAISVQSDGARRAGQEELLRSASKTITATLRETDIPSYAGDGVFAILLVGLRKKNTQGIVNRLIERIRRNAGTTLGARAIIEFAFGVWSGKNTADIDALNRILKRYHKKL
ncbi:MAG: DnaJ domain-containing protein [Oscillospiraceae bacterium]|nr:DnaJ domain-containing protein [Oscillospiraceae bacterium]